MDDNKNELILALEKMNMEYIELKHSEEYLIGKRVKTFINLIKQFRFIDILKKIYELKKINKFLTFQNIDNYDEKKKLDKIIEIDNEVKEKIVVYSCITGKYDNIQEPFIKEKNLKYILFTDNKSLKSNIWEIRDIPENILKFNNSILINRYIKMHPKELFPEYDYSYYIDGNVKIISEITSLIKKVNKNSGLALHKHKARKCVYDEIDACIMMKRGNAEKLEQTREKFINEQMPKNYGLFECNLIIADLNNEISNEILNSWWQEFYNSQCYRDQIYFVYALWKNNILSSNIGVLGNNIYKNPKLRIVSHK